MGEEEANQDLKWKRKKQDQVGTLSRDAQLVPLDGLGQGLVGGLHPLVRGPGKLDLVKMIVWNTQRVIHC